MLSTRARVIFGMETAHKKSISASLTKVISDAIVFVSIRAASSQKYARVAHAMAQFVLKIAKFISFGLSRPSKCYFVTVSVPDNGFCFVSTLKVRSFSIILFCDFPSDPNYHLNKAEHFSIQINFLNFHIMLFC